MIKKRKSWEITAPIILLSLTLTFAMLFVSCDTEPKDTDSGWEAPAKSAPLSENIWADGEITKASGEAWYSFTVKKGTTYRIWVDDTDNPFTEKTADVVIMAYYSDGTKIWQDDEDINWNYPASFSADTSDKVYVKVTPVGIGTFAIVYSTDSKRPGNTVLLIENTWANGEVTGVSEEIWYSLDVTEGETYRIWWNERGGNGDGSKTGDIVVGAWYENGNFIFGSSSNIAVNDGWDEPQSFTATVSGTVYVRVATYLSFATYLGTFGIVYSTGSTRPDVPATPWAPSADVVPLDENVWADGVVTSTSEEIWYSIDVTEGTIYRIWWNGTFYGDGSKTGNIVVGARYKDGNFIFGNSGSNFSSTSVNNGWGDPQSFTANSSGTVYVRVKSYGTTASNIGTFGIVYSTGSTRPMIPWIPPHVAPLDENIWADGNVTGTTEEIWYSFSVTQGTNYRIWWNERGIYGDGSKTGDVIVGARYEDGTFIFGGSGSNFSSSSVDSGWSTPQLFTASSSGTVYVRVISYGTTASYLGTFGIVYSSGTTRPVVPAVPWTPPVNATSLDENVWANGNVTSGNEETWYTITVTEGTSYRIWWNEKGSTSGEGAKTGNIVVGARHEDGTFMFGNSGIDFSSTSVDTGWSTPQAFTANSSGTVYVRVIPYNTNSSNAGTFDIVYSTGTSRPLHVSALYGKWYGIREGEAYDFRSDGTLFFMGQDFGVTYTLSGDTLAVTAGSNTDPGTATVAVSGSSASAGLIISDATANSVLFNGMYSRSDTVQLDSYTWSAAGTVTSMDVPVFYSLIADAGTTYRIWIDDRHNTSTSSTTWVQIVAFYDDGNDTGIMIWPDSLYNLWATPASFTVPVSGRVYIGVFPLYTNSTGTFRIAYSDFVFDTSRPR